MNGTLIPLRTFLADRYEVLNFLAAGSMQEVYFCFDHALSRHVAVKAPKGGRSDRRFKRGAEMSARVNHPNIASTFDYFEDENITWLVEEYVDGTDLGKRFQRDFYFLDPFLAAHTFHHITRALCEAHKSGICHRDLKPSNIMTSNDCLMSTIKLTDFGIAKLAEETLAAEIDLFEQDESTLTSSNTLLGALPYMAPECWTNWTGAGQPMDIWSLGCIGYQLLKGELPFGTGRNAIIKIVHAEQRGKVDLEKPAWFGKHSFTARLEEELWNIICSCIEISPQQRPTANDVLKLCSQLCYATTPREIGTITKFPTNYPNGGGIGNFGFIEDDTSASSLFFHGTVYFGTSPPTTGNRVCFSTYPGNPSPRVSPVLELRPA